MGTTSTSTSTSTAIGGEQPPTPNELEEVVLPPVVVAPVIEEVSVPVFMDEEDTPAMSETEGPQDEPTEDKPKTKKKRGFFSKKE